MSIFQYLKKCYIYLLMSDIEWSDDENDNEYEVPPQEPLEMPEEEEEDSEYEEERQRIMNLFREREMVQDLSSVSVKKEKKIKVKNNTLKQKTLIDLDIKKPVVEKKKKWVSERMKKHRKDDGKIEVNTIRRCFNPRLPIPVRKTIVEEQKDFIVEENDFPSL